MSAPPRTGAVRGIAAVAVVVAAAAGASWYFARKPAAPAGEVLGQVFVDDGALRFEYDGWADRCTIWDVSGPDPRDVTQEHADRLPAFRRRAEEQIGMTLAELAERCRPGADRERGLGYR